MPPLKTSTCAILISVCTSSIFSNKSVAQCHTKTDRICHAGCTELAAGGEFFSGVRCVTGTNNLTGNIQMDGSDSLIICGTLNQGTHQIVMNNGSNTIHITEDGTVTGSAGQYFNNTNDWIVYGSLTKTNNFEMNNSGSASNLYIGSTGVVDLGAGTLQMNNDNNVWVASGGSISTTGRMQFNGTTNLCIEEGSAVNTGQFEIYAAANTVTFGGTAGQKGCMSYTGASQINNSLTSSSDVVWCEGGSSSCGTCNKGSATVETNCGPCAAFLPVDLIDFTASRWNNGVLLQWTTLSEINNDYFIVERSQDGVTFETFEIVNGSGASSELLNYNLLDDDGLEFEFYRLIQVDFDGTRKSLKIIRLEPHQLNQYAVKLTPNPYSKEKGVLHLLGFEKERAVEIAIYDPTGHLVDQQVLQLTAGKTEIDASELDLSAGIYMVNVSADGIQQSLPLVVVYE